MKGGWAGETGHPETWPQFDELPRGVKRLFWDAPYNYTAHGAWLAWRAGVDMRAAVQRQADAMRRDVQREALRLYGPMHPQAGV
jgi:hypothetical protein